MFPRAIANKALFPPESRRRSRQQTMLQPSPSAPVHATEGIDGNFPAITSRPGGNPHGAKRLSCRMGSGRKHRRKQNSINRQSRGPCQRDKRMHRYGNAKPLMRTAQRRQPPRHIPLPQAPSGQMHSLGAYTHRQGKVIGYQQRKTTASAENRQFMRQSIAVGMLIMAVYHARISRQRGKKRQRVGTARRVGCQQKARQCPGTVHLSGGSWV